MLTQSTMCFCYLDCWRKDTFIIKNKNRKQAKCSSFCDRPSRMTSYAIAEELSLATKMLLISSQGQVINLIMRYHHRWHLVNVATRWQKQQLASMYYATK